MEKVHVRARCKMWKGYNAEMSFSDKTVLHEFWMLLFMLWISSFGTSTVCCISKWLALFISKQFILFWGMEGTSKI